MSFARSIKSWLRGPPPPEPAPFPIEPVPVGPPQPRVAIQRVGLPPLDFIDIELNRLRGNGSWSSVIGLLQTENVKLRVEIAQTSADITNRSKDLPE